MKTNKEKNTEPQSNIFFIFVILLIKVSILHTIFLNALQKHWDAQLDKQQGILPVT